MTFTWEGPFAMAEPLHGFGQLGTQVALNLLILILRVIIILHYVTIGKTYFFPGELAMYITRFITHLVPKQEGPLTPNLQLAAHGPIR